MRVIGLLQWIITFLEEGILFRTLFRAFLFGKCRFCCLWLLFLCLFGSLLLFFLCRRFYFCVLMLCLQRMIPLQNRIYLLLYLHFSQFPVFAFLYLFILNPDFDWQVKPLLENFLQIHFHRICLSLCHDTVCQRQRQNIAFFKMMFRFLKHIPLNGTLPTDFPQNAFFIFLKQYFRCVLSRQLIGIYNCYRDIHITK